jgi:hypothetical protein
MEVLVATTVMAAIFAMVFALLDSSLRREHSEELVTEADRAVALTINRFRADVRQSRALVVPATGQDPAQILTLDVTQPDGTQARVRGRVTTATVVREEIDLLGTVGVSQTLLTNALPASPTFAYFNATGNELEPGVATPSTIASCTAQLRVDIHVDPGGGRREVERQVTAALPSIGRGEVTPC